jgi:hypothetical protein
MEENGTISVSTAARRLRKTYRSMLDLVLRGVVGGEQDQTTRRWAVTAADVVRLEREQFALHALKGGVDPALAEHVGALIEALRRFEGAHS